MKTIKCSQLGGACDVEFKGNTFEEVAEQSKQHGMEMFAKQDADHIAVMAKIQMMMAVPGEMEKWFEQKRQEFNDLPED